MNGEFALKQKLEKEKLSDIEKRNERRREQEEKNKVIPK